MKTQFFLGIFLGILHTGVQAQDDTIRVEMPSGQIELFVTEFEDHFNGSQLDRSIWMAGKGVPRDPEQVLQQHYFKPGNITLEDGIAKLWIRRDTMRNKSFQIWITDGMKDFRADFAYSAAEITSTGQYGYGLYEIKCKIPRGKGFWPAFWVYGEPGGRYNELDVFEFWNEKGFLKPFAPKKLSRVQNMTVHFDGGMSKEKVKGQDVSDEFHTYTLVWDDCKILWYFDGELRRVHHRYKGVRKKDSDCSRGASRKNPQLNVFPIDEGLRIIAGVGTQSGEDGPDADTELPQAMEIDYIRYAKQVGRR